MNSINTKLVTHKGLIVLLMWFSLLLSGSLLWAEEADGVENPEADEGLVMGPFDGVSMKERTIWINDRSYTLDRSVRVEGTASKLGLMSDLKQGEEIKARVIPNDDRPNRPIVILIERL